MSQSNRAGTVAEDDFFAQASSTPMFGEKQINFSTPRLSERASFKDDEFQAVAYNNDDEEGEEEEELDQKSGRNGLWGTTLAVISTIMGGGIVSVPYAYAVGGMGMGITI